MSLVAYDYSSDENSDQEDDEQSNDTAIASTPVVRNEAPKITSTASTTSVEPVVSQNDAPDPIEDEDDSKMHHLPLPAPKKATNDLNIEEEDDEFLRKKAVPELMKPTPLVPISIRPNVKKNGKVQITIPSLRDFRDDDEDNVKPKPPKPTIGAELPNWKTGLLSMLPKPKSEAAFSSSAPANQNGPSKPIVNRLIPDSVANRPRNVPTDPKSAKKPPAKKPAAVTKATGKDSDGSDDDDERMDFFSLNLDEKLPEISTNEINAMVAKRAAKMAEAVKKFNEPEIPEEEQPGTSGFQQYVPQSTQDPDDLANERALSSLIGGNKAKRARLDEVNIIDISSADIVPSKEDFLRRQLQDETGYVPTGHLTGDWTCTSKRKSHITYLASKAQANAQELEAMWSSNRQSRRQTQSKYGF